MQRADEAFVVLSADDWEREQETLHVLQSQNLMGELTGGFSCIHRPTAFDDAGDSASRTVARCGA